jgi:glycosyltransferase involved in cell wall biosynthesis
MPATPRVLHVITSILRGGAENHLVSLVEGQRSHGWNVTVAYLWGADYWRERLSGLGVSVHGLGLRFYGDPRPVFALRRVAAEVQPTLVHAHLPPAEAHVRLAGLGGGRPPLVITKHNDEPFWKLPAAPLLTRWAARHARRIVAISEAVRRYMIDAAGIDPARLVVIRYGIDPEAAGELDPGERERLRTTWGANHDTDVIGTIARLAPQKGLDTLLDGFARFVATAPRRAILVIVGRGELEAKLRTRARELGLDGRVIWGGYQDEAVRWLQAFDVFALTSRYEGFGLVLLEAMAASLPIVATRVSAIPEVVVEDETAILVPPDDPVALERAFTRVSDRVVRERLGRAGRARVERSFGVTQMVERTMKVYDEALRTR